MIIKNGKTFINIERVARTNEIDGEQIVFFGKTMALSDTSSPSRSIVRDVMKNITNLEAESYINILCKETNNIEPMHAMTQMVGKRWEIVAKAVNQTGRLRAAFNHSTK
jgi:hypothetical protein